MTASPRVVIGADTHLDSHHLAVITDAGKPLADTEFPTSQTGYDDAVRWAQSFGTIVIAGVEGTSSYGAGLTWVLQAAGIEVAEVSRPDRAARRRQGKSDPLDAYAAARAALAGHGVAVPKDASTGALRAQPGFTRGKQRRRRRRLHGCLRSRQQYDDRRNGCPGRALPAPADHGRLAQARLPRGHDLNTTGVCLPNGCPPFTYWP